MTETPRDERTRNAVEEALFVSACLTATATCTKPEFAAAAWSRAVAAFLDELARQGHRVAELARDGEPERIEGAWRG